VSTYRLAAAALQDLEDLAAYIGSDNPAAADRVSEALLDAFQSLADRPGIGHARPDLTTRPVRFFTVSRRYMIVYQETSYGALVLRIVSAGRDVTRLL
jgi:plasmid stabilization system protein ParE